MMIEAWRKRKIERRQCLSALLRQALAQEEESKDPVFLFGVVTALVAHLQQRKHNAPRHNMDQAPEFFSAAVLPEIQKFARSQTEEDFLLAEFLEQIIVGPLIWFRENMREQEKSSPALIFQAPSAMSEVSLA